MLKEADVRASLGRSIAHLPSTTHDAIVSQFKKDGLVANSDSMFASADNQLAAIRAAKGQLYELRTPLQACEASPKNIDTVRWLRAELGRVGYSLEMEKPINEIELNKCLASAALSTRYSVKSALGAMRMIAP